MYNPERYYKAATKMIQSIIVKGRHIQNEKGMIIGHKDKDGNITGFAAYKGTHNEKGTTYMEPLYQGIYADKAAEHYVKQVGPLVAFGEAVKFFREQNATVMIEKNV